MGVPYRPHYLETGPLNLTAQHFPLPCSLSEQVQARFADAGGSAGAGQAMELAELLGYLRGAEDPGLTPMESILVQTEAIGDPALPTLEQAAVLHWLGAAFQYWEEAFPLEEPLRLELRRVKPFAATLALLDPAFLTPGEHPLHRILDTLQLDAVGWQPGLGRAGQPLQTLVSGTVEELLSHFDKENHDLEDIFSRLAASSERDIARVERMMQRLIETEQGRIKTADARRRAALMINGALEGHLAPPGISEFLKGPWYDSAQLILLKFGADSEQWAQMSATTTSLLDSVQPAAAEDSKGRQHFFDMVTRLPRELKRWLISLQHDSAAVGDAVGLVEFAHLQVLRNQELELGQITPITVADLPGVAAGDPEVLENVNIGQWFRIQPAKGEPLRARLVLRMEDARQLVFANHAGIKVLQQGFGEFAELLAAGSASRLDCGASFSRALARAAGIATIEDLTAIPEAAAEQARREEEQRLRLERARLEHDQRNAAQQPGQEAAPWTAADAGAGRGPLPVRPDLQLAMGTWLGFHDVDPPLLAKLAVHDRENDHYIFVNRSGIKLREISGENLQNLVDQELLDILESRSSFRDRIAWTKSRS